MFVANPFSGSGSTCTKFTCPSRDCTSTLGTQYIGSASSMMRHFRYHPNHAGEGVTTVLFATCQVQAPSNARFAYISDEYGTVGTELMVKGGLTQLTLHPSIPRSSSTPAAHTDPEPHPSRQRPEPRASCKRLRDVHAPRHEETDDDHDDDARWAEQRKLNADQLRINRDQHAFNDRGAQFFQEQGLLNRRHEDCLRALEQVASCTKDRLDAEVQVMRSIFSHLKHQPRP